MRQTTLRRWILAVSVAAGWQVGIAPAAAEVLNVKEWVEQYNSPVLVGAGVAVEGRELGWGELGLSLSRGRLYPVVTGGGLVGAFFIGEGSLRYAPTEANALRLWAYNVDKGSDYDLDPKGAITDRVERALILLSSGADSLFPDASWTEGEPPAEAATALTDHLVRWGKDRAWRFPELMPQARIDVPSAPVVAIDIQAGRHDLVFLSDPMRDGDESLAVMVESKDVRPLIEGTRYPQYLSLQPVGRERLDPRPAPIQLIDLDVEVVNPSGRDCQVTVKETYRAAAPVKVLALRLLGDVLGTSGATAAPTAMRYELKSVTDGAGKVLVFHQDFAHQELLVELPERVAAGATFELQFALTGDILYRPGNDSYWQLAGPWYPTPMSWAMESFTYHAVVKSSDPFTPFSHGKTVRRWDEEGLHCAEFRAAYPMQQATILAGKYHTYADEREGLTVRVSSYALKNESAAKTIASLIHGCVEFYEQFLGEYPFGELNVLEINEVGWAQAPAGLIFVTKEAFVPGRDAVTQAAAQGINRRIAHEVAHGWWGHVAKLGEFEDQWLSESLADYYAAVAMGHLLKEREFKRSMREWQHGANEVGSKGSVYMANFLTGEEARRRRHNLLYQKGPLVLHALRLEVGDDVFFTIFKSLLKSFPMQPARTKDFIGLTEFITKKDWDDWFDRYLFGGETPKVK